MEVTALAKLKDVVSAGGDPVDDRHHDGVPTNTWTMPSHMPMQPPSVPPAFTSQRRDPAADPQLMSPIPARDIPRLPPAHYDWESDSEDEGPDLSTSKVKEPSRTPSGTPPPVDEGLDAEVAELIASFQALIITHSPSLAFTEQPSIDGHGDEPAANSQLIPATDIPRLKPAHCEIDSEAESSDHSTSKVKEPPRTPSGTPLPADGGPDAGVADLVTSVQGLIITHSHSLVYSEAESPDHSTSKVKEPSRTPSGTPPPADGGLDAGVAELVASVQELIIAQSQSLGDPIEAPAVPTLNLSITDPDSFLREIIVTQKYPVLFLGESRTRALPLAIGAMRGSLEGIRATCYHHSGDTEPCHWHAGDAVKIDNVIGEWRVRIGKKSNRDLLERKGTNDDQTRNLC
jgi:hypothetical protein